MNESERTKALRACMLALCVIVITLIITYTFAVLGEPQALWLWRDVFKVVQ